METASIKVQAGAFGLPQRFDWNALLTWLLGFSLVTYLGLEGGGFDPLVHDQVGIAVWWIVMAAVLAGALPRRRVGWLAWAAAGLFAALAAWTALSLGWTESSEETAAELARTAGYLGVFALAVLARGARGTRRMVSAVGCGVAVVAFVALASRLHPEWFPAAADMGRFLGERERLSYPLNYWNALAALIAIGLPAVVQMATEARHVALRALAAAALPAMGLACFLTLSRGGIAAAVIAIAVLLVFTADRLPKLLTLLAAGAGTAILIAAVLQREALQEGLLTAAAREQGDAMLTMTIVVCAGVGLVQAGLSIALTRGLRPRSTVPSPQTAAALAVLGTLAVLVAAVALDAPGRASDGWAEFKGGDLERGAGRLHSAAGEGRYRMWSSAARQNASRPLSGTGPGTFEYWWARDGDTGSYVQDAHSLYMQTLGELGIVGLALLAAFLVAVLVGGGWRTVRASAQGRPQLAAALAGCVAFSLTAVFDWMWQMPAVAVAFLLLAASLVSAGGRSEPNRREDDASLPLPLRVGIGALAAAAIVAIAIPLASTSLVRESQSEAAAGELPAALAAARDAQSAQPDAATPHLQEALLLEAAGRQGPAAGAARAATAREPTNAGTWVVRSRIEARRGRAAEALQSYRRARSLDRYSPLLAP